MTVKEYINDAYYKLNYYIKGIQSGSIIANKYIKQAIERYLNDINGDKYEFRKDKFERLIRFCYLLKININNEYTRVNLLDFQIFFIANVLSIYKKGIDERKYKYAYLFIAKKNGKSTFAGIISLYLLLFDNQIDAQGVLLSNSFAQSRLVFDYIQGILLNSRDVAKLLDQYRDMLIYQQKNSKSSLKICGYNPKTLQGKSTNFAILDEIQDYPDNKVFSNLKTGTGVRKNPLFLLLSTGGQSTISFAYELFTYGKRVLSGEVEDENFFFQLYTLDDNDRVEQESNWYKSNPALGQTLNINFFRTEFDQSIKFPTLKKEFITYNLNVYTNQIVDWIDPSRIKEIVYKFDENDFIGENVYIGVDLSCTTDLTSISLLFYKNEKFYSKTYFFCANRPDKFQRRDGKNLLKWIERGEIYLMETENIDSDYLFDFIMQINSKYNIMCIGYDRFESSTLFNKIKAKYINCQEIPQTALHFNEPIKKFEEYVVEKKIFIDDNGCMLWQFQNIVIIPGDTNGNLKIGKNKKKDAIDGPVSLIMALRAYLNINYDLDYLKLSEL